MPDTELAKTDPLLDALEEKIGDIEEEESLRDIAESFEKYREPNDSDVEQFARLMAQFDLEDEKLDFALTYELGRIQANYAAMKAALDKQRSALYEEWPGHESIAKRAFKVVAATIATQKLRHVKTLYGRVGFRLKPEIEHRSITDEDKAMKWAKEKCPSAVKKPLPPPEKVLKSKLPFDCPYLDIETIPEYDEFYFKPDPTAKALPAENPPALPEPE